MQRRVGFLVSVTLLFAASAGEGTTKGGPPPKAHGDRGRVRDDGADLALTKLVETRPV